jgi:transketolase
MPRRASSNGTREHPDLKAMCRDIRRLTLEMTSRAKSSHVGSVFSAAEILSTLYARVLNVRPDQPDWPDRDRFVMSKGHACAGLYAALALRGFFPQSRLQEFYVDGGSLYGHATHKGVPGVEVSTGSLGHGLAMAVGLASGAQRLALPWRVYALLSDGECDEGSTWEAALLAQAWKLDNLTAIIDYNKIQSLGRVEEVIPLEPFAEKWSAFGWSVESVDGHDLDALFAALDPAARNAGGRPRCVIAHTIKGKGISFMEDDILWHYRSPQGDELARALAELDAGE